MQTFKVINTESKSQFNSLEQNKAVRVISERYGVCQDVVRTLLDNAYEFGLKKSTCSAQRIIDFWDDHCAEQFSYDCEEYGLAA